ncbi:MAG: hypothetical protein ABEJ44_05340 [Halanaeroarchaeum sp.]
MSRDSGNHTSSVEPSWYDVILLAIPIIFLGGVTLSLTTTVSHAYALAASSVLSGLLVAHGLFVRPPLTVSER